MATSVKTAPLPGWTGSGSPYHPGEQAVQACAGSRESAERMGRKMIRDFMPDQHRAFFAELPFVVAGLPDADGQPWATILTGAPGFVASPDPRRLEIGALPGPDDPAAEGVRPGAGAALVGIQFETGRRNRVTGRIADVGGGGFGLSVDLSFGNCPKYINRRTVTRADPAREPGEARAEGPVLSARAAALVRGAGAFFIASASPGTGGADPVEGVDVNHRGGRPGFVRVAQSNGGSVLTAPDFAGNAAFSTFGNLVRDPRAGLLFLDFATGDLLSLRGTARVIWDGPEVARIAGALRLLEVAVDDGVFIERAVPLRWSAPEPGPRVEGTGTWAEIGG